MAAVLNGKAHAQDAPQPEDFIRIDAVEIVQSSEIQADGTLKIALRDGRVVVLAADDFVVVDGVVFVDVVVVAEGLGVGAAAAVGGSPLLFPLLAAGGAGVAAAAGGGGGGDSSSAAPLPASPPVSPPAPPPAPPVNQAPAFSSATASVTRAESASAAAMTAAATDPDGNTVTYSLSGVDAGLFDINATTGAVTFKSAPDFEAPADADRNNTYTFTVSASDGTASATQTVTITVTNANDTAPVFTSGATASVAENSTATVYTAAATDADGSAITYSLSGADAALFDIDSATGAVTFKAAPDFEAPQDAGANNNYTLVVTASDGVTTTSQTLAITVTNINDAVPVFSSGGAVSADENQTAAYTSVAADADTPSLTYSLSGTDAALFDIDAATGAVAFKSAPDFESPDDADGDNVYDITVSASDGAASTARAVAITVRNTNDNAPAFMGATAVSAGETSTHAFYSSVSDRDGDTVTLSLLGPDAALFDVDQATGIVTFKTAPDYEAPSDADGDNLYKVTVSAFDGVNTTNQDFLVFVVNQDDSAPAFTSPISASVPENTTAAYTAVASDPDGFPIAYSLAGTDAALFDIDAVTGAVTFKTAPNHEAPSDADQDNIYIITVVASDGTNSTNRPVAITVTNINDTAPVATGESITTTEDTPVNFSLLANDQDADGNSLQVSLVSGPAHGALSGDLNGAPTYTPNANFNGVDTFTYSVSDGLNVSNAVTVTINVTAANDAPSAPATGALSAGVEDAPYVFTRASLLAGAADLDGDTLSVTGLNASTGSVVDNGDGAYTLTTPAEFSGNVDLSYSIEDGHGGAVAVSRSIAIAPVNDGPAFTSGTVSNAPENANAAYTAVAIDPDGADPVSYEILQTGDFIFFSINAATGAVRFRFIPDYDAMADFDNNGVIDPTTFNITIRASDGTRFTDQNVTINVVNLNDNAPVATGEFATTGEDTPVAFSMLSNDLDADGDPLLISVLTGPSHGVLSGNLNGTATYTPHANFNGVDTITYQVSDGEFLSNIVTLTINVTASNDAPAAHGSIVAANEDTPITGALDATDIDGDALAYAVASGPQHGVLVLQPDGTYTYTPFAGYTGPDSFTFNVSDGHGGVSTGGATIDVANTKAHVTYFDPSTFQFANNPSSTGSSVSADHPRVFALEDGGHIITWAQDRAGGSADTGWGVYAQRYDSTGQKTGSPTLVNTTTASDQAQPSGAPLAGGGYVIVWASFQQDGGGHGIYAQHFDASGAKVGGEQLVNVTTAGDQIEPCVAAVAGGYIVTWNSADGDVHARIFGGDGVPASGEFVVNENTSGVQANSRANSGFVTETVTTLANGRIAVVWTDRSGQDGFNDGVFVRIFNANGTPASGQLPVTTVFGVQNSGSIGALADGGFVVTWHSEEIFAQRFDANGVKIGGEFQANTTSFGTETNAKIQGLADGGFVIVWQSDSTSGSGFSAITGQRYDANGAKVGGEFLIDAPSLLHEHIPSLTLRQDGALVVAWRGLNGQSIEQKIVDDFAQDTTPVQLAVDPNANVNSPVSGMQNRPEVAALSDGGHVVVWMATSGANPDNSFYGIYAQRYDSAEQKVGGPVLVNTTVTLNQFYPSVAALSGGGYVVVWQSESQDGSSLGVYAQRFDASGAKAGGEQLVNLTTQGIQHEASVAALGGGYVVTWTSAGNDIHARTFAADGTPLTGEILVNENTTGDQNNSGFISETVTALADGKFAITWNDNSGQDGSGTGIYVRLFNADGTPAGGQALVNTTTIGDQRYGSIGALADGGFVVTWGYLIGDIFAQRFDGSGARVGGEFRVNTYTADDTLYSKVEPLADGGFVIVWQSKSVNGSNWFNIAGQRYDASGVKVGGEFIVNTANVSHEEFPSIALRSDGALVVVWRSQNGDALPPSASGLAIEQKIIDNFDQDTTQIAANNGLSLSIHAIDGPEIAALPDGGHIMVWATSVSSDPAVNDFDIYAQRFDAGGQKVAGPILVNTITSGVQHGPSVDALAGGGFVVVWESGHDGGSFGFGIFAQRFDALGAKIGGEVLVNVTTEASQSQGRVAALGTGYVVTWTSADLDVHARIFAADGTPLTGEILVNQDTAGWQGIDLSLKVTDNIAALADGKFAIVWLDEAGQDGSGDGIFVRVFNADGTPAGGQARVNTATTGDQYYGSIGALADGGFVVTWTDSNDLDGSRTGVFAQRFDGSGAKIGGQFQVNTHSFDHQWGSKVQQLADGGFVVVWQSTFVNGSSSSDIVGQRYDANGVEVGGEFIVTPVSIWSDGYPAVTLRADGALVVAWTSQNGGVGQKVITDFGAGGGTAKSITGGLGPDALLGSNEIDALDGAVGDDCIAGLGGGDSLTGGAGSDTFVYFNPAEGGDVIAGFVSGADRLEVSAAGFGGGLLAGGAVTLIAGVSPAASGSAGVFLYDTAAGQVFWDKDGAGAGAAVLVANLQGAPALAATDFVVTGIAANGGMMAPIVMDLAGDGFGFRPALFDFDSDGVLEAGSWPAGDAILALDRNGDGAVTSGGEISFLGDAPGAMTDLEGLRAYDSNSDGVLSAADDRWADFRVWSDGDSNGVSDPGELRSLSDAGVASISLARGGAAFEDEHGNIIHGYADVTLLDGAVRRAADISLRYEEASQGVTDLGVIRAGGGVEDEMWSETLADASFGDGAHAYYPGLEGMQGEAPAEGADAAAGSLSASQDGEQLYRLADDAEGWA